MQEQTPPQKLENFSYSKIGCFESCKYKYKLVYEDKHFISDPAIATDFGTLIHYIEETMANIIIDTHKLNQEDYKYLINLLYTADIHEKNETVLGVNKLKELYPVDWESVDKSGRTYQQKIDDYVNFGIYRLRNFLIDNPDYEVVGTEVEFNLDFRKYHFHGFIDRVFRNVETGDIYIEDIKTWNQKAAPKDLAAPLQFVVYSLAAQLLYNVPLEKIHCAYEVVLCDMKQPAHVDYMTPGVKALNDALDEIEQTKESGDWSPNPTPLCHWCTFSHTKPNQPAEAKWLCPYFSHWTKTDRSFKKHYEWMGPNNHEAIMQAFLKEKLLEEMKANAINTNLPKIENKQPDTTRRLLVRR